MIDRRRIARIVKSYFFSRKAYKFLIRDWKSLADLRLCSDAMATMRYSVNLEPVEQAAPSDGKIAVIAPHPDDEMIGMGGTLIKMIQGGAEVSVLYLSKGKSSESEKLMEETRKIADEVGYNVWFLDNYSKGISIDENTLMEILAFIKSVQPKRIFLPFFCDDHDDHRRASHLLWLLNKKDASLSGYEIWAYQVYTSLIPNIIVDITDIAEAKKSAIKKWQTQGKTRDWAHFSLGLNAYNCRFIQKPGKNYVEAFFVVPGKEYFELCDTYFSKGSRYIYYSEDYRDE